MTTEIKDLSKYIFKDNHSGKYLSLSDIKYNVNGEFGILSNALVLNNRNSNEAIELKTKKHGKYFYLTSGEEYVCPKLKKLSNNTEIKYWGLGDEQWDFYIHGKFSELVAVSPDGQTSYSVNTIIDNNLKPYFYACYDYGTQDKFFNEFVSDDELDILQKKLDIAIEKRDLYDNSYSNVIDQFEYKRDNKLNSINSLNKLNEAHKVQISSLNDSINQNLIKIENEKMGLPNLENILDSIYDIRNKVLAPYDKEIASLQEQINKLI